MRVSRGRGGGRMAAEFVRLTCGLGCQQGGAGPAAAARKTASDAAAGGGNDSTQGLCGGAC